MFTKKAFILILLSLVHNITSKKQENKFVIGAHYGGGFFAIFFGALNHLDWCERNDKIPVIYWDKTCPYFEQNNKQKKYNNAWEYYFEPVSKLKYKNGDAIRADYFAPDGTGIPCGFPTCKNMFGYKHFSNRLIHKYIKIKPDIQNKINNFYDKNFKNKKILGIHLRGTDKKKEVLQVDPEIILKEAKKYSKLGYSFFVATDEEILLEKAKKILKNKVISYPSYRSKNNEPVHYHAPGYSKAKLGEEILIEVILLSKCEEIFHTSSNVPVAAMYFNPQLKNRLFI